MNKPSLLVNLVRSLPRMEELTIWSSLRHVEDITQEDLQNLVSLKLAGLEHSRYLLKQNFTFDALVTCFQFPGGQPAVFRSRSDQAVSGEHPV